MHSPEAEIRVGPKQHEETGNGERIHCEIPRVFLVGECEVQFLIVSH